MPDELKEKIAADFRDAASDGSIGERLKATGQVINVGGPKEFAESIDGAAPHRGRDGEGDRLQAEELELAIRVMPAWHAAHGQVAEGCVVIAKTGAMPGVRPSRRCALAGPATAQSYPSRVIKLVVPFTPGSPNDVMARLLTQHLAPRLGQPIVIDNKPGGGTTIGTKAAAMPPSPTAIRCCSSARRSSLDPAMKKKIAYDPLKDFAPVATVNTTSWLIAVSPTLPVKTMAEFVAHTKAHPGTMNFAATQGTAAHAGGGDGSSKLSGADVLIVPYKGGAAALPDFLGGRIQVLNPTPSTSIAAHSRRQDAAAADHQPGPHRRAAGGADRARGRPAGADARILGGRAGAGRHAAGHRRQAQRRDQRHAALAGDEGQRWPSSASTPRSARRRTMRGSSPRKCRAGPGS